MLRKIRIVLAVLFFAGITLLFAGIGHQWWGWMARLQFLPSCLALNFAVIPGIFRFYNNEVNNATYVTSREQEHYARARRRYLAAYNKAIPTIRQADHCISCRRCVQLCPQHIFIPWQLNRINDYLEKLKQETLD